MIETERHETAIFRITLNRPDKRNALSFEMCRQLAQAFEEAARDPSIRVIVMTANGTAFCSGMDLHELEDVDLDAVANIHNALFNVNKRLEKPIIAAVHGDALAGGTGLVANAHIVIAGPRVAFGLTEIKIGLWPFLIYKTVAEAIGDRLATEWSLTGRVVDAEEAKSAGLVHKICKNPYESAFETARSIVASSKVAISSGLSYIRQSKGKSWEESGRIGHQLRNQVMQSPEFADGLRAFQEKRSAGKPPVISNLE
jgi:enoyl-CoA hydratase/carnithine racemase